LTALIAVGFLALLGGPRPASAAGPLTLVDSLSLGARAHDIAIADGRAYVAIDTGLVILDLANPVGPVELGSVSTGSGTVTQGVEVQGAHAYLASREAGVHVVNVANPAAPVIVGVKRFPQPVWDVAVRGTFVYAVTSGGYLYVLDVSNPASPRQVKVIGLVAWGSPKHDAIQLKKLNAHVTRGNAKAMGVTVVGDKLFTCDWGYGRAYYYDVSNPASPVFRGTHRAPFILRVAADPARDVLYMLGAYARQFSGIHTVPISQLSQTRSTDYLNCPACRFLKANAQIDMGGLGLSPGGKHLFYGGGLQEFHVVDVSDPALLHDIGFADTGPHGLGLAEIMGFASHGDHIYVAAGAAGLQIYSLPAASE
jgi:hypothetical protein